MVSSLRRNDAIVQSAFLLSGTDPFPFLLSGTDPFPT